MDIHNYGFPWIKLWISIKSNYGRPFRHWLHRKLSECNRVAQPVKLVNLTIFCFQWIRTVSCMLRPYSHEECRIPLHVYHYLALIYMPLAVFHFINNILSNISLDLLRSVMKSRQPFMNEWVLSSLSSQIRRVDIRIKDTITWVSSTLYLLIVWYKLATLYRD